MPDLPTSEQYRAVVGSNSLMRVRDELIELRVEDDPTARPTQYAYRTAWELTSAVGGQMLQAFPYGYVMEDGEGGVRIEWESQGRHVRLVISAEQEGQHYIYHQRDDNYGTDGVSVSALTGWLYWFCNVPSDAELAPKMALSTGRQA